MMTPNLGSLFDWYTLRARLYPAFLAAMPVVVTVALVWEATPLARLWPLVIGLGVLFFLATWVRGKGQEVEKKLVHRWDGMPTTHMLRFSERVKGPQFDRRRGLLAATVGIEFPTESGEARDPDYADAVYVTATRALIARVRAKADQFPRIHEENMQYGFRRNLYAMRPIALSLLIGNLIFDVAWLLAKNASGAGFVTLAVHIVLLLAWTAVVNQAWVRQQGDTYAERLFEALEDPRLAATP